MITFAKFKELKALLLLRNPTMPESYFLESFIGGLTAAIKPIVRAFKPATVSEAIEYARQQEESIQALKISPDIPRRAYTKPSKPALSYPPTSKPLLPAPVTQAETSYHSNTTTQMPLRSTRFIPEVERAEKIAKGLCYLCDKPFDRGHKCRSKGKQLFLVEVLDEDEDTMEEAWEEQVPVIDEVAAYISMNAIYGNTGFQKMRVNGHVGKKTIHILIDSGSTHNFWMRIWQKDWGANWSLWLCSLLL